MSAYATAETRAGMEGAHREYLIGVALGALTLILAALGLFLSVRVESVVYPAFLVTLTVLAASLILHGVHRFMVFAEHGTYAGLGEGTPAGSPAEETPSSGTQGERRTGI